MSQIDEMELYLPPEAYKPSLLPIKETTLIDRINETGANLSDFIFSNKKTLIVISLAVFSIYYFLKKK